VLNVGVLGSGMMGSTHARAYTRLPDVQVVGVSSLSHEAYTRLPDVQVVGVSSLSHEEASALAEEVGAAPFTDASALATDPRVHAVSITLPTHLHRQYAIQALDAGKHVFVEKPMGLTVEDCDAMIEAARKNDRLLMVAHVLRFWPEYMALVGLVQSGKLGRPLAATAFRLSARPRWGCQNWFANPAYSGGAVLDMQVHDVDALNWIFGTPRSVYSRGERGRTGGWDHVLTLIDYGEAAAFAEGSVLMPEGYPFYQALQVLCEKGSVEFASRAASVGVETGAAEGISLVLYEAGQPPRRLDREDTNAYENEVAYFVDCVRRGRTPDRGTAAQGRLAVQTAAAARRSLETGQIVML